MKKQKPTKDIEMIEIEEAKEKEIWRSFEGQLDAEQQTGVIVYEIKDWYEVENVSVWTYAKPARYRFRKPETVPDWETFDFGEVSADVENGRVDGQVRINGKWYSPRKVMERYQDVHWRRHI